MKCTNCGETVPDSAKVCGNCGHRLVSAAPVVEKGGKSAKQDVKNEEPKKNRKLTSINAGDKRKPSRAILQIGLIALGAIAFLVSNYLGNRDYYMQLPAGYHDSQLDCWEGTTLSTCPPGHDFEGVTLYSSSSGDFLYVEYYFYDFVDLNDLTISMGFDLDQDSETWIGGYAYANGLNTDDQIGEEWMGADLFIDFRVIDTPGTYLTFCGAIRDFTPPEIYCDINEGTHDLDWKVIDDQTIQLRLPASLFSSDKFIFDAVNGSFFETVPNDSISSDQYFEIGKPLHYKIN